MLPNLFAEPIVLIQGISVGIILGILLGYGFAAIVDFNFVIPWSAMIAASIITFIVAVVSGSYPAIKAAKLDPVESLRHE